MTTTTLFFRRIGLLVVAATAALAISSMAANGPDEFDGTNLLADAVILQTGSGSSLTRTNLSWSAPTNINHPALVFAFGFASDEIFLSGEFFDSFSITLRNADRSFVAPVLTADMLGVTMAPSNADTTNQFHQKDLQSESLSFPPLGSTHLFQQTFLILVVLPPELVGQSGTLGVNLFDNLDNESSVGFISHISVVPGPGTVMVLESSASVGGPYAKENGIVVRHARQCLSFSRPGASRFYRLRAGSESLITLMQADGANWAFQYTGAEGTFSPTLESSAQASGPYAVESGVISDSVAHTLLVPQEGVARFFRIRSELPLMIRSLNLEPNQTVIRYEQVQP